MSTGISYLDEVFNVVSGCSGKGCKARCWAKAMVKRFPQLHGVEPNWITKQESHLSYQTYDVRKGDKPIPFERVHFHPDRLDKPLHWRKPRRVGVCFTGDWMDDQVPESWLDQIMGVMNHPHCERHQFFTLTKQARALKERLAPFGRLQGNIWSGVSVCDQDDLWMVGELLKVPGKKWISIEPFLNGPIDLSMVLTYCHIHGWEPRACCSAWKRLIHWVVLGAESGPKRRPMPLEWAYSIKKQCAAAEVPLYIKQLDIGGKVIHDINLFPEGLRVREMP